MMIENCQAFRERRMLQLGSRQQETREEFVVAVFVEPRALDVEQLEPGAVCEGERVDRELRNGPVGPSAYPVDCG